MVVCACHLCFVVMTMNHMAGTKGWQFSGLCCHGLSKESKISLNLNAKFHWLSKGSSSKHLYLKNPNSKLTPFLHYELHKKRRVQVLSSSIASPNTTLEFLTAYDDEYGGIIIDPQCLPSSANSFASALHVSLFDWKQKGKRGIWLKILLEQADLIPIAIQEGFNYHHTEPGYVMLTYWIPDEPCLLPASPSHHIGVGGFVINEQREILVVKEKGPCSCLGVWKFPTGYINKSEDIFSGVTREVREETGIDTTFLEIVAIRHAHLVAFEQSDLLFVCLLKPVSFDIIIDEKEIQAAKWMPLDDFVGQQFFQEDHMCKRAIDICVAAYENRYSGFTAHQLTSKFDGRLSYLYYDDSKKKS